MKHSKPNTKRDSKNELTHFKRVVFGEFYHNQKPVWAETIQREKHWQQDPTHDSPTIKKVEYSDGFGRILQTRAQAEDVIFGATEQQRRTGNSGLPADQNAQNQPAIARKKGVAEADNVVVSGWKVYNNKGKVVEEYEPFFDKGYEYKTSETYTSSLAKMTIRYDAGDRPTETEFPDGSKSLIVYGVPDSIVNPPLGSNKNAFTPSPWERYTYDQNDLGPLTGGSSASTGAFTPKSETVDALGRTIRTTEHDSQPTSNPNVFEDVVMKYEYDIQGNLKVVKDPYDRVVFTYNYNLQQQALFTNHIDSGISRVVLDVAGKPIQATDAKDAETLSAYDKLQRPIFGWSKNNASDSLRMTGKSIYGEQSSNPLAVNLLGKIWEQYDESGMTFFRRYDFKGNLTQKIKYVISSSELKSALDNYQPYLVDWTNNPNILGDNFVSTNDFDALNRITAITLPADVNQNQKQIIPFYNRAGALDKVEYDNEEYVKHIAYNAKGQRLLIAFGNDVMTRYTYDTQTFRLKRQRSEKFTYQEQGVNVMYNYQSGTNKQDDVFAFDLVGNILEINKKKSQCGVGGTNELKREFTYDPMYRLASATGRENVPGSNYPFPGWDDTTRSTDPNTTTAYTQKYTYDKVGNIDRLRQIGSNPFTREFDYTESGGVKVNNRLDSITIGADSYFYQYDAAGNQTLANSNRKFDWDAGNRLLFFRNQAGTSEPSVEAQYLYDSSGNRVKKIVRKQGGNYEIRVYIDGIFEYFTDEDEEQNTVHIMDDQSRIATVRIGASMGDTTPAVKYTLENNIGSSVVTLDDTGSIVNEQEYYPFGETSFGSYGKKRYQYTGKERDEESGLYYYGARYYAPWTCRFNSVDPKIGEQPNFSSYLYANNNPVMMNDPSGMQAEDGGGDDSDNIKTSHKVSENITINNVDAQELESKKAELDNVEKGVEERQDKIDNLKSEDASKKKIRKAKKDLRQYKKENNYRKLKSNVSSLEKSAKELDTAIRDFIDKSKDRIHTSDGEKYGFKEGEKFNFFESMSDKIKDRGAEHLDINVRSKKPLFSRGKVNDHRGSVYANGSTEELQVDTDTRTLSINVNINPTAVSKASTLANEMGDVYYKIPIGDRASNPELFDKQVEHDNTVEEKSNDWLRENYRSLHSTIFSNYIQSLFKK